MAFLSSAIEEDTQTCYLTFIGDHVSFLEY